MDFVFLDVSPGLSVLGTGPFSFASQLPAESSVAFYLQDFGLAKEEMWAIPAKWERVHNPLDHDGVLFPSLAGEASWRHPNRTEFSGVFGDIANRIVHGELQKAVPAVVERIQLSGLAAAGDRGRAPAFDDKLSGDAFRFGYRFGRCGAFGLTPEILLSLDGLRLKTMALAGTAPVSSANTFGTDAKQIREHQFVVDAVVENLGRHGKVNVGERRVIEFAQLLHFRTLIDMDLNHGANDPAALVKAIHPTPAVGVLPRTAENLAVLGDYRRRLGVPDSFGAPLGVWCQRTFHAVAAIRGFFFDGESGCLPAGCGIIEESVEEKEWEELRLKRAWVKERIGLA